MKRWIFWLALILLVVFSVLNIVNGDWILGVTGLLLAFVSLGKEPL